MWGYYGSKSKIIDLYPSPLFGKIIEPFAGTAQYALKYWEKEVILIDKYDIIVELWKWLQTCSKSDIIGIRKLNFGENVDDFNWNCQQEKWLIGFIISGAPSVPKKTATKWKTLIRPNTQTYKLNYIANNLHKIKHWDIRLGDYRDIANQKATWFIDPPYVEGGQYYKHGTKDIDFGCLATWCKEREGQVIVCEKTGANWLPFNHLTEARGNLYKHKEAIWVKTD